MKKTVLANLTKTAEEAVLAVIANPATASTRQLHISGVYFAGGYSAGLGILKPGHEEKEQIVSRENVLEIVQELEGRSDNWYKKHGRKLSISEGLLNILPKYKAAKPTAQTTTPETEPDQHDETTDPQHDGETAGQPQQLPDPPEEVIVDLKELDNITADDFQTEEQPTTEPEPTAQAPAPNKKKHGKK